MYLLYPVLRSIAANQKSVKDTILVAIIEKGGYVEDVKRAIR